MLRYYKRPKRPPAGILRNDRAYREVDMQANIGGYYNTSVMRPAPDVELRPGRVVITAPNECGKHGQRGCVRCDCRYKQDGGR